MSRNQSRRSTLGDFDVITGPPAAPAGLQKPAEPMSPAELPPSGSARTLSDPASQARP